LTKEESFCSAENRDCNLRKVGGLLLSNPIAFPMSTRVHHSLSWGIAKAIETGTMDSLEERYKADWPSNVCSATVVSEDNLRLPAESFVGTVFVSAFFMLIAGLLAALEEFTGRRIEVMLGVANPEADPEGLESPVPGSPTRQSGTVIKGGVDLGAERVAVHPDFCNVEVKSKSEESLDFIMGAIAKLKDKQDNMAYETSFIKTHLQMNMKAQLEQQSAPLITTNCGGGMENLLFCSSRGGEIPEATPASDMPTHTALGGEIAHVLADVQGPGISPYNTASSLPPSISR